MQRKNTHTQTNSLFELIPNEVLKMILDHLSPEQARRVSRVAIIWNYLIQNESSKKLAIHFPHVYGRLLGNNEWFKAHHKNVPIINWHYEFEKASKAEYAKLNEYQKNLFTSVKTLTKNDEYCNEKIKNLWSLPLNVLYTKDSNEKPLGEWIKIKEYEIYGEASFGLSMMEGDDPYIRANILAVAVYCNNTIVAEDLINSIMHNPVPTSVSKLFPHFVFSNLARSTNTEMVSKFFPVFERRVGYERVFEMLEITTQEENLFMTDFLLSHLLSYAKQRSVKKWFNTPSQLLKKAVINNSVIMVNFFINDLTYEHPIQLNINIEHEGKSLLYIAISKHYSTIAKILFENGAKCNDSDNNKTLHPLICALNHEAADIADFMLSKIIIDPKDTNATIAEEKININEKIAKKSLLEWMLIFGYLEIAKILINHPKIDSNFSISTNDSLIKNIFLLNKNLFFIKNDNLLHVAARLGDKKIIRNLMNRKIDSKAENTCHQLPIDVAATEEIKLVIKLLQYKNAWFLSSVTLQAIQALEDVLIDDNPIESLSPHIQVMTGDKNLNMIYTKYIAIKNQEQTSTGEFYKQSIFTPQNNNTYNLSSISNNNNLKK